MPAVGHLPAGEEIDGLVSDLRAAGNRGRQRVTGPFFLELTLRKARRQRRGRVATAPGRQGHQLLS